MHQFLVEILICPTCHGNLEWQVHHQAENRIVEAGASCKACGAEYPVRDGIGVFLTPDLPREDLWEEAGSGLSRYLSENPQMNARLMDSPLASLNPTDRFYRAMMLEEEGNFDAAKTIADEAFTQLYTEEYLAGTDQQYTLLLTQLENMQGPVVDLASGRGYLVERMLRQGIKPVVMTDFSPRVLKRNRTYFGRLGLYDTLSLVACDARRLPFRDDSIETLTSYLGLPNMKAPGDVLRELSRVGDGVFWTITQFYHEDDEAHRNFIQEQGFELLYEKVTLDRFEKAGWQVAILNRYRAKVAPTPESKILVGARIDGMPLSETEIDICLLRATSA